MSHFTSQIILLLFCCLSFWDLRLIGSMHQRCSTLLPLATCGDRKSKYGDWHVFRKWISNSKYTLFLTNFDKSGDSKAFIKQLCKVWRLREYCWTPLLPVMQIYDVKCYFSTHLGSQAKPTCLVMLEDFRNFKHMFKMRVVVHTPLWTLLIEFLILRFCVWFFFFFSSSFKAIACLFPTSS